MNVPRPMRPLDIRIALDPSRCVVVEACAGSGKTWLLVARMMRALLAGAKPAGILALTFTRKAAQEMRERLDALLLELATVDDAAAVQVLVQRGLDAGEAQRQLPRARALYAEVLAATPTIAIDTFHGWFIGLARRAPLSVQDEAACLGAILDEASGRMFEEASQRFGLRCGRAPSSIEGLAFQRLLGAHGLFQTRALLESFCNRGVEWQAFVEAQEDAAAYAAQRLRDQWGAGDAAAGTKFVARHQADLDQMLPMLADYSGQLALWGKAGLEAHAAYAPAEVLFEGIGAILINGSAGVPRTQLEPSKKVIKAWGAEKAEPYGQRLKAMADAWLLAQEERRVAAAHALNADVFACGVALFEELDAVKRETRRIAFSDIESLARRMLGDSDITAYLHERLDARIRHVLIDEFQDTNPVQWLALKNWFAAYGDDASRPGVFVVGDPKQSIYRFRRADARLFETAKRWLQDNFGAEVFEHSVTRRNASSIVQLVNTVFSELPGHGHFHRHEALDAAKPGRVELLPLAQGREEAAGEAGKPLRDPLLEKAVEDEDMRAAAEGAQVAGRIRELIAGEVVRDRDGRPRPLRCADIMLLARQRRDFVAYGEALREAGIPFITSRAGGLLDSLEASDLAALLNFLMTPSRDLWLAHVLRSPLMGASDTDLMLLAQAHGVNWWHRLQEAPNLPDSLVRARRLLAAWKADAGHLPVHDLLDRILAESNARARYAAAAPGHMREQVSANLDAFVELALNVDSGRFPSLPRFLDELRRMAEGSEQEAPGEGLAAREDAVRLMTVHAAKGLEAPVVVLLGANAGGRSDKGHRDIVVWEPDEVAPSHFSVMGRKAGAPAAQLALLEAEGALDDVEALNVLYVALTRAKQVLVVSGVQMKKSASDTAYLRVAEALKALGDKAHSPMPLEGVGVVPLSAMAPPPAISAATLPAVAGPTPIGRVREPETLAMRDGTRMHLALQWLADAVDTGDAGPDAARLAQVLGVEADAARALLDAARQLCGSSSLTRFFDPAQFRSARNEMTYVAANGEVRRIDRLVVFEKEVWVLDYKVRVLPEEWEPYRAQVQAYAADLAPLFAGKRVAGGVIDLAAARLLEMG